MSCHIWKLSEYALKHFLCKHSVSCGKTSIQSQHQRKCRNKYANSPANLSFLNVKVGICLSVQSFVNTQFPVLEWRAGGKIGNVLMLLCCCCSVTNSCTTLWNPMDCSIIGSSVLHYLLEFAQIHVHWIGDTI